MKITHFVLYVTSLMVFSCGSQKKPQNIHYNRLEINDSLSEVDAIVNFINPYKQGIDKEMNRNLSFCEAELNKSDGGLESSLGNLMADAVLLESNKIFEKRTSKKIDFCLLNHGGIRSHLPAGPVTVRSAYSIMPFENETVVLKLSGKQVESLIKFLVRKNRAHPISGLRIQVESEGWEAKIQDQAFDPTRSYYVVTSDYLQQGGDDMAFLKNPEEIHVLDYKIRNILIDYFDDQDRIVPNLDHRFTNQTKS